MPTCSPSPAPKHGCWHTPEARAEIAGIASRDDFRRLSNRRQARRSDQRGSATSAMLTGTMRSGGASDS